MARSGATDALFTVVRSELGEFLRYSAFHVGFTNPYLEKLTQDNTEDLDTLAKRLEDEYLSFCNPENPHDFMTIWTTRGQLAKIRLLYHYSCHPTSSVRQTDTQQNMAIEYALQMLECDTNLMNSPLTKGYKWFNDFYFPFPAFVHILQDLRKRPSGKYAERAWQVMSSNHEARMIGLERNDWPFFVVFSRLVLQAWDSQEAHLKEQNRPLLTVPRIVAETRAQVMLITASFRPPGNDLQQPSASTATNIAVNNLEDSSMPMSMDLFDSTGTEWPNLQPDGQSQSIASDLNNIDWTAIDWDAVQGRGWS